MSNLSRRDFLRAFGIGVAAVAAPAIVVPERRIWQVPRNAPVGSRIERVGSKSGLALVEELDRLLEQAGLQATLNGQPVKVSGVYWQIVEETAYAVEGVNARPPLICYVTGGA